MALRYPIDQAYDGQRCQVTLVSVITTGVNRIRRDSEWRKAISDPGVGRLKSFFREFCNDIEWDDICDSARIELSQREAQISQRVLECHSLATHPSDPNAEDVGVPEGRVEARLAQAACYDALQAEPDNPRILYQFGRVLDLLGNVEAADYYYQSARLGYVIAELAYGRILAQTNASEAEKWVQLAANKGFLDAQLLLAEMLIIGFAGPPDVPAARRILERAADADPRGKIALANLLLEDADTEQELVRIRDILSTARRQGVSDKSQAQIDQSKSLVQQRLAAFVNLAPMVEKLKNREEICQELLDFDPLEVFGLAQLLDLSGNVKTTLKRRMQQKIRRMNIDKIVAACDETIMKGSSPPKLMTRYALVLSQVEEMGRDYGQTKGACGSLYRDAAAQGDPVAMFFAGAVLMSSDHDSSPNIHRSGVELLENAHMGGIAEATIYLAMSYLPTQSNVGGHGSSPQRAVGLLESISGQPIPLVKALLAAIYSNPQRYGLSPNFRNEDRALELLGEAVALGALIGG